MSTLYLFDGTLETYQSILPVLWNLSQDGDRLQPEKDHIPGFFEIPVLLVPDTNPAQPVINDPIFREVKNTLVYAFSSGYADAIEQTPSFLYYVRTNGHAALSHLAEPSVNTIIKAARRTAGEAHKLKGLLRFRQMGNILYGPYFSKSFVLPLLGEHFKDRLSNSQWILHDTERSTGIFYNGKQIRQAFFDEMEVHELTALYEKTGAEDSFEALWKKYFDTIAIEYRKNPKLQRSFMPKQYWRYIPEVAERVK
ncbi:MAG TPA: TIGR03915 family putative DNA repair protein [bacterium]|nr:TIGR03915 family putative DNA repair protein [bacterium]